MTVPQFQLREIEEVVWKRRETEGEVDVDSQSTPHADRETYKWIKEKERKEWKKISK